MADPADRCRDFNTLVSHRNVEVRYYNPIRIRSLWKINYRLHEKYLIADDKAYILGGRNISNLYLSANASDAYQDRDVLIYETDCRAVSSLKKLRTYFEKVWNLEDCIPLTGAQGDRGNEQPRAMLCDCFSGILSRYGKCLSEIDWFGDTMEVSSITVLSGDPAPGNKQPDLWRQICRKMREARCEVIIQTPFVLCKKDIIRDLAGICKSGLPVRILTNDVYNSVNPLGAAYPNLRQELLKTGVLLYEYGGEKPMHTKTILIDDRFSMIGSYNLDSRSVYLNTEVMLVIDCPKLNRDLREQMDHLIEQSSFVEEGQSCLSENRYPTIEVPFKKKFLYGFLQKILKPFRYLL